MTHSANNPNVAQTFNTFFHLIQELEPFVKVDDLRVAFNGQGDTYLEGDDFQERLNANFTVVREVQSEMRSLIAKHRSTKVVNTEANQSI